MNASQEESVISTSSKNEDKSDLQTNIRDMHEVQVKVGPQDYATISTLCGARHRFGIDEASRAILDDSNFRELQYSAYLDFDPKKKKMLGDYKSSLPVIQMIRRDNATQRQFADKLLGKEHSYFRDPRPLSQQFAEMTPDQMSRKMIELELDERIATYAPRRTKISRYTPPEIPLSQLLPERSPLHLKDLHVLIHMRQKPTGLNRRKLTAREREYRLLTPQAKEILRHRHGLEEYDSKVEASIAQAAAKTRMQAVQSNAQRIKKLKDVENEENIKPKPVSRRAPFSSAHLARASSAARAAAKMTANSTSFFAAKGSKKIDLNTFDFEKFSLQPIPLEEVKKIRTISQRVKEIRQSSRYLRKRAEQGLPDMDEVPENMEKILKENRKSTGSLLDMNRPIYLETDTPGQTVEYEFNPLFRYLS